jgi:hypothetical protein
VKTTKESETGMLDLGISAQILERVERERESSEEAGFLTLRFFFFLFFCNSPDVADLGYDRREIMISWSTTRAELWQLRIMCVRGRKREGRGDGKGAS